VRRAAGPLLLVALLVASAACGRSADDTASGGERPAAGTALRIEVRSDADADPTTMTLTCDPVGGDHPQAEQACDALAAAGPEVMEPVAADQACTMLYGGPQTARVTGTLDGAEVDATFSRADGCEVDRWDALGTTFFDVPLQ
jgi:hypothetical protein